MLDILTEDNVWILPPVSKDRQNHNACWIYLLRIMFGSASCKQRQEKSQWMLDILTEDNVWILPSVSKDRQNHNVCWIYLLRIMFGSCLL
ncbi:hypothetical protein DPMN_023045 [Dreissena polymorpha]|uniref:Uncharacterized protein n=1 Tax=Dreissena polymorpha TaxID=45954 RepID=A0A9D4LLY6_DREPO|nr:hypothetical protein DPMN_023045 [Dreissena polymorpha]